MSQKSLATHSNKYLTDTLKRCLEKSRWRGEKKGRENTLKERIGCRLKKMCPASFRETCQWLKFPLNGLGAQSRVSPAVALLPLASGPACLGVAFPPFLMKVIPLLLGRHFLVCENRVYHEKVSMTVG